MQNDFKPVHMEDAKKRLSGYLKEAEATLDEEKEHYREVRKRDSWWYRLLRVFRG